MKRFSSKYSRLSGFTLVELLVVMGIIAILIGVVGVSASSAIRFAKRTKTQAMAVSIQTAMQNYYTEYGVYPTAQTGATPTDDYYSGTAAGNWPNLIYTLCGNISAVDGTATGLPGSGIAATANTRSIAFLSPQRSDVDTTTGALYTPFGKAAAAPYFFMVVDNDYSNVAGDTGTGTANLKDFTATTVAALGHGVTGGVAVWSSCDQTVTGSPSASWAHTY